MESKVKKKDFGESSLLTEAVSMYMYIHWRPKRASDETLDGL